MSRAVEQPGFSGESRVLTKIANGLVVTEKEILSDAVVLLAEGRIAYVGPEAQAPRELALSGEESVELEAFETFDARGGYVCPGLIDLHIHGGGGADTMDGSVDSLKRIAQTHAAHGTTGLLATTMTEAHDKVMAAAKAVKEAADEGTSAGWPGARILGLHLEGPYINAKRVGAQNPAYVRPPDLAELREIREVLGQHFRLITLAPEVDGGAAAMQLLLEFGVTISLGHTDATYEEAREAFAAGAKHVTHMYNAMSPLHHRDPGVVGAALLASDVICEMIADGIHLHPAASRIVWEKKGTDRVCLVTDAIAAAGMSEGQYQLGGLDVYVKDGACRLEDGRLAGSVLTMDRAVGHMVNAVGLPVVDAVRMASLVPARQIGFAERKGNLAAGKDADVTVLDDQFRSVATWVEGRRVH